MYWQTIVQVLGAITVLAVLVEFDTQLGSRGDWASPVVDIRDGSIWQINGPKHTKGFGLPLRMVIKSSGDAAE